MHLHFHIFTSDRGQNDLMHVVLCIKAPDKMGILRTILRRVFFYIFLRNISRKSKKENPQKLTQLSSRSHPRHLVGKKPSLDRYTQDGSNEETQDMFFADV